MTGRGALSPLVALAPVSLAACDSVTRTYAVPFWRAPYRECRDSVAARFEVAEFDADTLVTYVVSYWRVSAPRRAAEFAAAEAEVTHHYGPGFHCSATRVVWRGPDSVRVALLLQNESDVSVP